MKDYKISIPFGAFLTANSILIAADFVFLQLWFNFQPKTCEPQKEAIALGTIFVCYFVILSIVSMILAILGREKCIVDDVQGLPVILFFFSLGFTMCFVFQAIVTLTIKIFDHNISVGDTLLKDDNWVCFLVLMPILVAVTITAIVKPECWDKLFRSFKEHTNYFMLAILGILIALIGCIFIIGWQSKCLGIIIGGVLILVGFVTCWYCMKKCLGKDKKDLGGKGG